MGFQQKLLGNKNLALAIFFLYFFLDLAIVTPYQSLRNILYAFDFASILYSARAVASGFPLLSHDHTYYGLPTHAYHGLFVYLLGGSSWGVKLAMAIATGLFGSSAFNYLNKISNNFRLSFWLTAILWIGWSSSALGFGQGYGAYYVALLLLVVVQIEGNFKWKYILQGTMAGLAYACKYELGLIVLATIFLQEIFSNPSRKHFLILLPILVAMSAISVLTNFFPGAFFPLIMLCVLLLQGTQGKYGKLNFGNFGKVIFGFLIGILPWIIWESLNSNIVFSLKQYFPFWQITEQMDAMGAHGSFFTGPIYKFNIFMEIDPSHGYGMGFLLFIIFGITLLYSFQSKLITKNLIAHLFAAVSFLVYTRESRCPVYDTWFVLPFVLGLFLFAVKELPQFKRQQFLLFISPVWILLFLNLAMGAWKQSAFSRTDHYQPSIALDGIKTEIEVAFPLDSLQEFFKDALKPEEQIFVFSGIRLPQIAARQFSPENYRMPYFLYYSEEKEKALIKELESNSKFRFVVLVSAFKTRFSGQELHKRWSNAYAYIIENFIPVLRIGPYEILENKKFLPVSAPKKLPKQ